MIRLFSKLQLLYRTQDFLFKACRYRQTFLYKCLCYFYCAQRKIVLCVASGIAALLPPGGRTAHSRFAIPLNIYELYVCRLSKNSQLADLIRQTSLISRVQLRERGIAMEDTCRVEW